MPKVNILYESQEIIYGKHIHSKKWIEYSIHIKIIDTGKQPVNIERIFVPPHPSVMNMPDKHLIKAENSSSAFTKK